MKSILQTKSKRLQEKIAEAPRLPGCYLFRDKKRTVIYVGKAKVLKNRVKSYFANYKKLEPQKQILVETISDVTFRTVDTEVEALILETNLIKKYRPKFNIDMKDDKNYIYVRFERVRRKNQPIPRRDSVYQDFPRISVIRTKKDDGAEYFGPFPNSAPIKRILSRLRKVFPYRTSKHLVYQISDDPLEIYSEQKKPDLYYHIGLSNGADAGLESKAAYIKNFRQMRRFFKGELQQMLREVEQDMQQAAKEGNFEEAAALRDKLHDMKYATSRIRITRDVDDVLVDDLKKKQRNEGLQDLIHHLDFPNGVVALHDSFRIECYDISNIQGKHAVGSMVVMIDGQIKPKLYRRFKIQMKQEPNDFGMLQEVLTRRFQQYIVHKKAEAIEHLPERLQKKVHNWKMDESFAQRPDIIIIDGGKGQLASTYRILYQFGLHHDIPIVSLAKREEDIFKITDQFKDEFNQINDARMFTKVRLPRRTESLYLVQRIRDEAHRFAITYHRNLRSKHFTQS